MGVVARWLKHCLGHPHPVAGACLREPAALLLIQAPADASWEAASESLSAWAPGTHVRDQDEVVGPWLRLGLALTVAGIWVVK